MATVGPNRKEASARLWVDELATFLDESDLEPELVERLLEFYGRARPDWRGALQRGELADRPEWLLLAVNHALEQDEAPLLRQLAELSVDWSRPVRGGALAGEVALLHRSSAVLELLLELGAPFSAAAFRSVQGELPEWVARRMLDLGARADAQGLVRCWTVGALAAARVLAEQVSDYEPERQKVLSRLREDLEKVRARRMGHSLGEKGLQEQIDRLSVDLGLG